MEGLGSPIVRIKGAPRLKGGTYRIIPDRIEAGTYLLAAAATRQWAREPKLRLLA